MMASPMYLSSIPSSLRTIAVIGLRYSLRSLTSSSGGSFSERVVKPRISEQRSVTSLYSPPSLRLPGSLSNSETSCEDTYVEKAFLRYLLFFSTTKFLYASIER